MKSAYRKGLAAFLDSQCTFGVLCPGKIPWEKQSKNCLLLRLVYSYSKFYKKVGKFALPLSPPVCPLVDPPAAAGPPVVNPEFVLP
jgi:hypothetical protein